MVNQQGNRSYVDSTARCELQALRIREAQLTLILEGVQDHAISMLDPNGGIVTWNATAERIKGYTLEEVRGKHFRMLFTDEDKRAGVPERELAIARAEGKFQGEGYRLKKDGTLFFASVSLSALRDERGELQGFVKVTHDITERVHAQRRAEALNLASLALSTALDEQAMLSNFVCALCGRFTDVAMIDFIDAQGRASHGPIACANSDLETQTLAQRAGVEPDFSQRPLSWLVEGKAVVLLDSVTDAAWTASLGARNSMIVPLVARGTVFGALVLARCSEGFDSQDVQLGEELARRLSIAIDNAKLYESEQKARKQADLANQAKDDFLANVSHELRSPLNAILGWARILRTGRVSEEKQERALEVIERNALTQVQLIEDLLDVSRIVNGKLQLELGAVDPLLLARQAIDALRPATEAKRLLVTTSFESGIAAIDGDANRLQQVIVNLLSNATKFTPPEGSVHVKVTSSNSTVSLSVQDSGCGIAPEFLPQLFQRFKQADAKGSRARAGLGLGLAISQHIVELHGGRIDVESPGVDKGATFTVTLPMSAAQSRAAEPDATSELMGLNVQVVDDQKDDRDLAAAILTKYGALVCPAEDEEQALGPA
jgi:PAS domain S-box-containing protein